MEELQHGWDSSIRSPASSFPGLPMVQKANSQPLFLILPIAQLRGTVDSNLAICESKNVFPSLRLFSQVFWSPQSKDNTGVTP